MVMKNNSDQIVVDCEIKPCRNNDSREIMTGILQLGFLRIAVIANVPQEGEKFAKIYFKPAGNGSNKARDNYQPNRVADKQDARNDVDDEYEFIPGTDPIL
jgi:hypothetical protein